LTRPGALFDELNQTFFHGRLRGHTVRWAPLGFAGTHGRLAWRPL
jgi:hypothetical protein